MSNKKNLSKRMLVGLACGVLSAQASVLAENQTEQFPSLLKLAAESGGNITQYQMTKEDLMLEVTQEGADLFNSLSPEGQALALKIASRACNGNNDCKGQNACRTQYNSCMGQGECKGKTKCSVSDKNLAVKLAAQVMERKRQELQQAPSTQTTPTHAQNTTTKDI